MVEVNAGTCTRYRCRGCGEEWTWRNTQEGRNAYARTNRQHDGELVPVGTEYRGLHRADEGGDPWPAMNYRRWLFAYAEALAARYGLDETRVTFHRWMPPADEYANSSWLGVLPGAERVDHRGRPTGIIEGARE